MHKIHLTAVMSNHTQDALVSFLLVTCQGMLLSYSCFECEPRMRLNEQMFVSLLENTLTDFLVLVIYFCAFALLKSVNQKVKVILSSSVLLCCLCGVVPFI